MSEATEQRKRDTAYHPGAAYKRCEQPGDL